MIVGREQERGAIARLMDGARGGAGGALVVRGAPGVGKTTLLADAAARADGLTVLRAVGVDAEAEIAFAGIDQALRPLRHLAGGLSPERAAALAGAVGSEDAHADRYTVALAALDLLSLAAGEQPVLLLVDDAHHVDRPSADAFQFIARRLLAEPVALVAAMRDDPGSLLRFEAGGIGELALEGLPAADATALLSELRPRVEPRVAEELARATGGNPLALQAAARLLTDEQFAGRAPLPPRIPAGEAVTEAYRRGLAELDGRGRSALLVSAASDGESPGALAQAMELLGTDLHALEEPPATELVELRDDGVVFRHPLGRNAIYHAASPAERRAAHRALAEALSDPLEADRRAWHLASAATGPDAAAARALEDTATRALRRGGYGSAAAALRRASTLAPDAADRVRLITHAAEAARLAGRLAESAALLADALAQTDDPIEQAKIHLLRGKTEFARNTAIAPDILIEGADLVEDSDPELATVLLSLAAAAAGSAGDSRRAQRVVERTGRMIAETGGTPTARAVHFLGLVYVGRNDEALAMLPDDPTGLLPALLGDPLLESELAYALGQLEIYDASIELHRTQTAALRASSALGLLPHLLTGWANVEYEIGRWLSARSHLDEAIALGDEVDANADACWSQVIVVRLTAHQSTIAETRRLGEEAMARASRLRMIDEVAVAVHASYAYAHLAANEIEDAIRELEHVRALVDAREGLHIATLSRWQPNLIEAYARAGRGAEAAGLAGSPPAWQEAGGLRWGQGGLERARGMVAENFEPHFERAIELLTLDPFERARARLCFGERLRRARRRADARPHLQAALRAFDQLGAEPWAARARSELGATGGSVEAPSERPLADLTPHELRVAGAVAEGATNNEVAARLFVTAKTVEYHLGSIYRKLGIRSRADLTRLYLTEAEPGARA